MSPIILNFHGVGPVPRDMDDGERHCWLDLGFFEAVLDIVRDYPHVRITVDDGNLSDFEVVLPALLHRHLRATFFICSARLNQPLFLSREQVAELLAQGMGIGSHGVEHRSWRHLSDGQLRAELEGSRRVLEAVCGSPVDTAACPFGAYDRRVLKGLRRAGYRTVYTSDGGKAREARWLQARTTVTRRTSLDEIRRLVQEGPGLGRQCMIDLRKLGKRLR
jgi:peptidoglycan/xylan/chitin deacetylase (PgdA/CDA1 family)